jgi:hypothetical protein
MDVTSTFSLGGTFNQLYPEFKKGKSTVSLNDFCWVIWDNKKGKIVAYNQSSGIFANSYNKSNLFTEKSEFLDGVARHILIKTPFSSGDFVCPE